jgi:hypothetical protein
MSEKYMGFSAIERLLKYIGNLAGPMPHGFT